MGLYRLESAEKLFLFLLLTFLLCGSDVEKHSALQNIENGYKQLFKKAPFFTRNIFYTKDMVNPVQSRIC
jgi:hypothetical protein